MNPPKTLFDRKTLLKKRARAGSKLTESFLMYEVLSEFKERILDSNRTFSNKVIITSCSSFWHKHMPKAEIISDESTLILRPLDYDLVLHTLCLHWANDPVGQLIQCRRALKPDGLFLCALLGGKTLNQLRDSLSIAEAKLYGGLSNRFSPMAEIREVGNILQRAGFSLPVADSIKLDVSYRSIYHLIHDLRNMGETNALSERNKGFSKAKLFVEAAKIYQRKYKSRENGIIASFEIIFLAGWAPDASQPQPLTPGSKATPLSDVLSSFEVNTKNKKEKKNNDYKKT